MRRAAAALAILAVCDAGNHGEEIAKWTRNHKQFDEATREAVKDLTRLHGEARVSELLRALVAMPARAHHQNGQWTVAQDVQLVLGMWSSQPSSTNPIHSTHARKLRLHELREHLPRHITDELLAKLPSAAPLRDIIPTAHRRAT